MVLPAGQSSCTPKRLEFESRSSDSFDGSMVFLDDDVAVSALTHQDIDEGIGLDIFDGCCVAPLLLMVIFSGTTVG